MAKKKAVSATFGSKRSFLSRLRKKPTTGTSPIVHQEKSSLVKTITFPQIPSSGLSYGAQHLILLIQHHVDLQKIKVPPTKPSWEVLVLLNQSVDLVEKKERTKEFCSIHHFLLEELDTVAKRVGKFVRTYQPHNVLQM